MQALHHYTAQPVPHAAAAAAAYGQLRRNLLGNVVREYQRKEYLWENYNDSDSHGRGSYPITGWTALFVLAAWKRSIEGTARRC